ncbi:hypothetical protein [Marinitoga sp. 38H-ov]|jgi:copper chaperone CopZ|uniref:hypothetical protein n=2 Tax=Marinitoga TaxID=160798 RepID=UPI0013EAA163|nr:hypothetical protein [Marinitoga sp. 38H-ov]
MRNELDDTKKIIIGGKIIDFSEGKTMKILKFTVKNWKKEIKEKIEKIEGVEKVVVKAELDKIENDIQQKFGNANIKVVDLSNTDISVDDVLEKLGIEKTQVATMENKELKHVIEVYTNDNIETVQNDVLKTFVEYKVQILSMEVN